MKLQLLTLATCLAAAYAGNGETCTVDDVQFVGCLNEINQGQGGWEEKDVSHMTGYGPVAEYFILQGRITCLKKESLELAKNEPKRVYVRGDNSEREYCIKFKADQNVDGEPTGIRYSCVVGGEQKWQFGQSKIIYNVFCKPLN